MCFVEQMSHWKNINWMAGCWWNVVLFSFCSKEKGCGWTASWGGNKNIQWRWLIVDIST